MTGLFQLICCHGWYKWVQIQELLGYTLKKVCENLVNWGNLKVVKTWRTNIFCNVAVCGTFLHYLTISLDFFIYFSLSLGQSQLGSAPAHCNTVKQGYSIPNSTWPLWTFSVSYPNLGPWTASWIARVYSMSCIVTELIIVSFPPGQPSVWQWGNCGLCYVYGNLGWVSYSIWSNLMIQMTPLLIIPLFTATLFLELWKRHRARHVSQWKVYDWSEEEVDL